LIVINTRLGGGGSKVHSLSCLDRMPNEIFSERQFLEWGG
jgi:hypothetical protein